MLNDGVALELRLGLGRRLFSLDCLHLLDDAPILDDLQKLICELVEIESVNPDLVPSGSGETQIAAFVAGWLERAGLEVEVVEASKPGRPPVVGTKGGPGGGNDRRPTAPL